MFLFLWPLQGRILQHYFPEFCPVDTVEALSACRPKALHLSAIALATAEATPLQPDGASGSGAMLRSWTTPLNWQQPNAVVAALVVSLAAVRSPDLPIE